jgi:hypothetical protein
MTRQDGDHCEQAEVCYRDRAGNPIDLHRWAGLWSDFSCRCVAETRIELTDVVVRTVWEGLVSPVAVMFATGISFDGGRSFRTPAYGEEARTEEEALVQHELAVRRAAAIGARPVDGSSGIPAGT